MSKIKDLINFIEEKFPPQVQESYDNSGFILGNKNAEIQGVLLTIDITENVVKEAITKNCNLIISHHPIIFRPLKKITGSNHIERTVIDAIKNDIAIYAAHTSLDNSYNGLNKYIGDKFGLKNQQIILPQNDLLFKLVTFAPIQYAETIRHALFEAGAGHIGNYDSCSYNLEGVGTFRAGEKTNPFVGKKHEIHTEAETRIETICTAINKRNVLKALLSAHPYEEPAYDLYPLANKQNMYGAGIIGELPAEIDEKTFLQELKEKLSIQTIRHSNLLNKKIKKVAICTGAGSFLINSAISQQADVFVSAEFKYNHFIDVQNQLLIVDAGHYETEVFIKNIFYELITKNFSNFAVEFSQDFENPVNYL